MFRRPLKRRGLFIAEPHGTNPSAKISTSMMKWFIPRTSTSMDALTSNLFCKPVAFSCNLHEADTHTGLRRWTCIPGSTPPIPLASRFAKPAVNGPCFRYTCPVHCRIRCESRASLPWSSGFTASFPPRTGRTGVPWALLLPPFHHTLLSSLSSA